MRTSSADVPPGSLRKVLVVAVLGTAVIVVVSFFASTAAYIATGVVVMAFALLYGYWTRRRWLDAGGQPERD